MEQKEPGKESSIRKVGEWALKILGVFVLLEPIWMLLPFAGFLYGSVFHIQAMNRNPSTAWLTHFVFPVLTLGPLGPILVGLGFLLFLIGAAQIYWAKIRKSGLVTGGLYRLVRHPQYISLTFFSVGILLSWGRAVTFLAFFMMMFLYYYLAISEERTCTRLFGAEYGRYRERTSFIFPGDRKLRSLRDKLPSFPLPAPVRVGGTFLVSLAACFGVMWLIGSIKKARRDVPYLTASVKFAGEVLKETAKTDGMTAETVAGVPFVRSGRVAVVRGPTRNAATPGFAERVLLRLRKSDALKSFLAFLDEAGGDAAIVFCIPFQASDKPGKPGMHAGEGDPGRRGPPPDPFGPDRARLVILRCTLASGSDVGDAFSDRSRRRIHLACFASVNLGRPEEEDMVEGKIFTPGPGFPGEDRWDFFLEQLAERSTFIPPSKTVAILPGKYASTSLVLVQAPILRTRRDVSFARAILDRLTRSEKFRTTLRNSGAGGPIVPVAFPRPGPNWYQEHHGTPQVSVFVILAHLRTEGDPLDALFRTDRRELIGAFTAELDFRIGPFEDGIGDISPIGPRRDLEERWRFFLSGL